MRKYSLVIIVLLVLIALVYIFSIKKVENAEIKSSQLVINNNIINVEIANTDKKRAKGLGDRQSMSQDNGMLFVFDQKKRHEFWMKDMQFSLDIIWIDDNQIVDISKNLQVENENDLTTYKPKAAVNYVLEVNAGYVDENNMKLGDMVEYNFKIS